MTDSVPLPPSLRKRFYEPVVLLHALKDVYRINNSLMEPDLERSAGKSQQQTYFCFLNKLSQICDSQPKQRFGATVSAIAVLDSGTIEYRFASNQRDDAQLETVKGYLTNIINVLGGVTDSEVRDKSFMRTVHSKILRNVLAFNRPRVENYLEALISNDRLGFCIGYAAADEANEGRYAAEALRSLQPHIEAAMNAPRLNHNEFTVHSEALLEAIHSRYESSLEDYMKQKTRDPMLNPDSPWVEVRHALGRLLSYFIAIKVLISARKFWPRLFVDFEVSCIPSSEPLEDLPSIRRTAKGIIQRMSRNTDLMDAYESHASHLQSQSHRLDDRIRDRVRRGHFTPIVHAEVNLLESVLRSRAAAERDGEAPLRFFNEAEFGAYLGTSKPPCLLCGLYFAAHPDGVRVRESHGNLYINWRAPDLSVNAGADPERQRRDILEAMVKEVRNHAGRAIRERSYTRKKYDSCTTPTNPLGSTTVGGSLPGRGSALVADEDNDWASRIGHAGGGWDIVSVASRRSAAGVQLPVPGAARRPSASLDAAGSVASMKVTEILDIGGFAKRTKINELASAMGQISLDDALTTGVKNKPPEITPGVTRPSTNEGGDDDDNDDDGGGALL